MHPQVLSRRKPAWEIVKKHLSSAPELALFLDYDGTLTSIRKQPSQAVLSRNMKKLLRELSLLPGIHLTIVTGRAMEDIRALVPLETIGFAANHGLQLSFPHWEWIHPAVPKSVFRVQILVRLLENICDVIPKVRIENKGLTIAIHYRNVDSRYVDLLKQTILRLMVPFSSNLKFSYGKKVFEIRPDIAWDKGEAIKKIMKAKKCSKQCMPIAIGDDLTDEDAFRVMRSRGVSIHVGKTCNTIAEYYLQNNLQVETFLKTILDVRKQFKSQNIQKA
jgi:alpha,alpha-trehalase